MLRNEELEAYQKDAYNQDVATYTFSAQVGGITSDERAKLNAKKPGVNLHFLRYGIFNSRIHHKMSFFNAFAPEDNRPIKSVEDENEPSSVNTGDPIELREVFVATKRKYPKPSDKACSLANTQYRITGINQGYIYILALEKDNNKFWLEFAVDAFGNLNPIYWKENISEDGNYKDIREEKSKKSLTSFTIKEGTKIWTTLSLAQLSIKQLEAYAKEPEKYDRLKSIVCNPIDKSSSIEERKNKGFRSFKEFRASYTAYEKTNAQRLQFRLNQIAKLEYPENRAEEDTTFEDLFILLEDPIQCANDLTEIIDSEMAWLKALTDTLRNAKTVYDGYAELMKLPVSSSSNILAISDEEEKEIPYIFALALATYKFVYDNEELKDDFSRKHGEWYLNHGIDDKKLDKILGITQRKKQRDSINLLRDDLGNFLKSDYYNIALNDFDEGSYPMIEDGKSIITDHLGTLVVHPTMIDRHLLLASEYKPEDDEWIQQIRKTITGKSDFKKIDILLDRKVPIAEVEIEDDKLRKFGRPFCAKFLSTFGKMAKVYVSVGALSDTEINLVDTKANYLTSINKSGKEGPFFKIARKQFIEEVLRDSKNGAKKLQGFVSDSRNHFTKTYAYLKIHEEVIEESKNIARRTGIGKKATIVAQGEKSLKYSKQLEKMVSSPHFQSAVLAFEIWALCSSVQQGNKNGWGLGNSISFGGALVKTTAASLNLANTLSKATGKSGLKFLSTRMIKGFSVAGAGLNFYNATKDMIKAVNASDNDAALAYSVAAGVGGYLLAVELGFATALSTGPFIVVVGIGMLAYGIAYYLTDSELEAFFKHYPFSTKVPTVSTSDNPYLYARAMYAYRNELIKADDAEAMGITNNTYKNLFLHFTNLIGGGSVVIKGSSKRYSVNDHGTYLESADASNTIGPKRELWTSMDIRISFASFLQYQQQIEFEIYLVQWAGLGAGEGSYRLSNRNVKTFMMTQENGTLQLQLWVEVAEQLKFTKTEYEKQPANTSVVVIRKERKITQNIYLQDEARIAVLCRFKGDSETCFPYTSSGEHGYLYTAKHIGQRNNKGILFGRSFNPMIITKQAFLNVYPLQNP